MNKATLYIIATPIGNLEDITLRAIRVLKEEVEVIFCEDTRVTRKLLSHLGIEGKKLISCNKENEHKRVDEVLVFLNDGQSVALMTDAGTPLVSDPGSLIVQKIYEMNASATGSLINISNAPLANKTAEAGNENTSITSLPGASALTTILSVCPFDTTRFAFEGFLPHSGQHRRRVLKRLVGEERPMVFYESPHRILKTLEDMRNIFSNKELNDSNSCKIFVARELTKIHEEFYLGNFDEIISKLEEQFPSKVQGEFVLILSKC